MILKLILTCFCWIAVLPIIYGVNFGEKYIFLIIFAYFLLLFWMFMFSKTITKIIISLLFLFTFLILDNFPSKETFLEAGNFFIIFSAFLPSLWLLRATAVTMPSVKSTQSLLSKLDQKKILSGLQLTSHFLGSVINIGSFPLLSSVLPKNSKISLRQSAGEASIRGMNTAVLWSPFFVSFAIGQIYLPEMSAWMGIGFGIIIATFFNLISIRFIIGKLTINYILDSLSCIKPIFSRLFILAISVLLVGQIFNKTALNAIIIIVPILVFIQILRRPETLNFIFKNLKNLIQNSGDEMLLISVSMFLGSILTNSVEIQNFVNSNLGDNFPFWMMIVLLPFIVWCFSLIGVHPIITSAPILSIFGPLLSVWEAAFLMQAHLIGWCAGTAISFTSLSVLTSAENFKISVSKLVFGPNFFATSGLVIFGAFFLILSNYLL